MSDIKYKIFEYDNISNGLKVNGLSSSDSLGSALNVYNFSYSVNRLKDCFGITNFYFSNNGTVVEIDIPKNVKVKKVYSLTFKDDTLSCLVIIDNNNQAFRWSYNSTSSNITQIPYSIANFPSVFNYVDETGSPCIACSYDNLINIYHLDTDECNFVFDSYSISEVSFLDNCAVGLLNDDKYAFWYSSSMQPNDWKMTGDKCVVQKVDLMLGKCLRIFKMEENLYLVREYGIQRLVYDIETKLYQIQNVGQSIGRIYKESLCQNGASIIFLSTNGLYQFNGSSIKRIYTNVEHVLSCYDNTATACQNGKYYISTKYDFNDGLDIGIESNSEYTNNVLISIDLDTKRETIMRGVDVSQIIEINTSNITDVGLVVFDGDKNRFSCLCSDNTMYGIDLQKHWQSIPTDFDMPNKKKIISKFFITTKQDITLSLFADNHEYSIKLKGGDSVQTIRPNLSGYTFSYKIETSTPNNDIYGMKVLVGYFS